VRLPVHPRWYNALIEAHKLGCSFDLITIVAIAEISRPIFLRPYKQREAADLAHSQFFCPLSDHITWLNALDAYAAAQREGAIDAEEWCSYAFIDIEAIHEALRVRRELQRIAQEMLGGSLRSVKDNGRRLRRAIARGLYHQLAFRTEKTIYDLYHTVHDNYPAMINPDSALVEAKHNWIVYQDFVYFSRPYLTTVTAVDIEWLLVSPGLSVTKRYFSDMSF
jgi:pre-mRNA-splicing factor ATP-dependent RNA helicase DHX15/PRP43